MPSRYLHTRVQAGSESRLFISKALQNGNDGIPCLTLLPLSRWSQCTSPCHRDVHQRGGRVQPPVRGLHSGQAVATISIIPTKEECHGQNEQARKHNLCWTPNGLHCAALLGRKRPVIGPASTCCCVIILGLDAKSRMRSIRCLRRSQATTTVGTTGNGAPVQAAWLRCKHEGRAALVTPFGEAMTGSWNLYCRPTWFPSKRRTFLSSRSCMCMGSIRTVVLRLKGESTLTGRIGLYLPVATRNGSLHRFDMKST